MFKVKPVILAAMLAVPAAWALASILSDTGAQQATVFASPDQVRDHPNIKNLQPQKLHDMTFVFSDGD
jgi:hypothetical protein